MGNEFSARAPSLAVLPFEDLSGEDHYSYFSRGLIEDLIVDLSHFSALQIISSYTSGRIADPGIDVIDAARKIEIDYLLKGSLFVQPAAMRLNTQLLDTESRKIIWAERFESPLDSIFDIQNSIVDRVVFTISSEVDNSLLTAAREKPTTSLAAYDCWLRGMDCLRHGSCIDDEVARECFNQALVVDSSYARAYAGLSLSHFNEWSCQLWSLWEASEKSAFNYAVKAFQLDEGDHLVQMILGRIYLYRRQFEEAEYHIHRSLELNGNDADCLVQLASSMAFLGRAREGEKLFQKALRLNPYRNLWYYQYGALVYFGLRDYKTTAEMGLKKTLVNAWVDLPALIACASAYQGEKTAARKYIFIFIESFTASINDGTRPCAKEMLDWIIRANTYKNKEDMDCLIEGLELAGLEDEFAAQTTRRSQIEPVAMTKPAAIFKQEQAIWHVQFDSVDITIQYLRGFRDTARLLASPENEVHRTELMGAESSMDERDFTMDDVALRQYEEHVLELRRSIDEAEEYNDIGRKENLVEELEYMLSHLSKNCGLGNRPRKMKSSAGRARAAVTLRIRSGIKKIAAHHPSLAKHLSNSIRTGLFCCYSPEENKEWVLR